MKEKNELVIGIIILLVSLVFVLFFLVIKNNDQNNKENNIKSTGVDKITAPASNTEKLLEEMTIINNTTITEDEIVFSDNTNLKENEKVAVWIYSEPKFLGYFEVLLTNGVKKIVGLKDALTQNNIEEGKHYIAITTEAGNPIGYIEVKITQNGLLTESISSLLETIEKNELASEAYTLVDGAKIAYLLAELEGNVTNSRVCFSLEYLYNHDYFYKGAVDKYTGSVLVIPEENGTTFNYKFWISNSNYAINDAFIGVTGEEAINGIEASENCDGQIGVKLFKADGSIVNQ